MSVVSEIQSAIAIIRKHQSSPRTAVQQLAAGQADVSVTRAGTGKTTHFRRYAPGTILDSSGGIEYDFPAAGLNAGSYVTVLQAELRAIASRLVMPEFMLTSDASNAAYASTMVAEGPAVKMFERLQAQQVADDLELMWRVVQAAIDAGRLPAEVRQIVPRWPCATCSRKRTWPRSSFRPGCFRRRHGLFAEAWTTTRSKPTWPSTGSARVSRSEVRGRSPADRVWGGPFRTRSTDCTG
jgi:hypothetical protein